MLTDRLIILYHHSTSVNLNLFDKFLPATSLSGGIVYISIANHIVIMPPARVGQLGPLKVLCTYQTQTGGRIKFVFSSNAE